MSRLAMGVGLLGLGIRGAQLLDAQFGKPLAHVDSRLEGLALHDAGNKATSKSVTCFS